jgi:hypothetical protein
MSGKEAAKEVLRELSNGSRKKGLVSIEDCALNRSLLLNDFMQSRSYYYNSSQPPAFLDAS